MCELFALSSRLPTTIRFSLQRFAQRGGNTAHHADGWGVAFYEERDVRLLREPDAAARSRLVQLIEEDGPSAPIVISHVRHATRGARSLANTQPFARELAGRMHVFAHNGDLPGIWDAPALRPDRFQPLGQTDSEYAFCALLDRLAPLWRDGATPTIANRAATMRAFAAQLRTLGPANFLYSDGTALFAHGDRRRQRDGTICAPGLWLLVRQCLEPIARLDGASIAAADQSVVLLASVPLTDEPWEALAEGMLVAVEAGERRDPFP